VVAVSSRNKTACPTTEWNQLTDARHD